MAFYCSRQASTSASLMWHSKELSSLETVARPLSFVLSDSKAPMASRMAPGPTTTKRHCEMERDRRSGRAHARDYFDAIGFKAHRPDKFKIRQEVLNRNRNGRRSTPSMLRRRHMVGGRA